MNKNKNKRMEYSGGFAICNRQKGKRKGSVEGVWEGLGLGWGGWGVLEEGRGVVAKKGNKYNEKPTFRNKNII